MLIEAIIQAIESSDRSQYEIAKAAGVNRSALTRLMKRERGVSVDTLEALAKALGLEISIQPKPKSRTKR